MKLAWLTDIHLNFLKHEKRKEFYQKIVDSGCDNVIISGDISESIDVKDILEEMSDSIKKHIYFVLGNHDYYMGSVADVRKDIAPSIRNCTWMRHHVVGLGNNTVLMGVDGWADGREGNYQRTHVRMNDDWYIEELSKAGKLGRNELLLERQKLADDDANKLKQNIILAVKYNIPERIIIITHIPPFKEICFHRGELADSNYLPFYCSKATGDILLEMSASHPNIQFDVYCGHTHGGGRYTRDNLCVEVGKADYYRPEIQKIIEI